MQDGILRHGAAAVRTGSARGLITILKGRGEILGGEEKKKTDATTVWLRPDLVREGCSEDLSWTVSLTASMMLSR